MAVYSLKLVSATNTPNTNEVILVVDITNDSNFTWQKTYRYNQTKAITLAEFKNRVITDIKKDLQLKTQLSELQAYVGQKISITI